MGFKHRVIKLDHGASRGHWHADQPHGHGRGRWQRQRGDADRAADRTDFIEYKKWLAEGNEPEPADATPVADTQGEQ